MPIVSTDIQYRLSGGAANADPALSLGGAISNTAIADATTHNLFDRVTGTESQAGDTEYRCFYVRNGHATLSLQGPVIYIQSNTPSTDTTVAIGLDPAGIGGTAATVANEGTAPAGVTFSTPASGTPLSFGGDLAPGAAIAVWVRRVVNAGAAAYNDDNAVFRVQGDTAA